MPQARTIPSQEARRLVVSMRDDERVLPEPDKEAIARAVSAINRLFRSQPPMVCHNGILVEKS